MVVLLVIGGLGLLLLLGGVLFGDLHPGVDGALDLGPITTPALGAALAAFGFGAALALGTYGRWVALLAGAIAAVLLGGLSVVATRALIGSDSQPVRTSSLVGVFGSVVTRIPENGLGEVVLPLAGTRAKLSARSHEPVPSGTPVYVVEVLSETSVVVQRADLFDTSLSTPLPEENS